MGNDILVYGALGAAALILIYEALQYLENSSSSEGATPAVIQAGPINTPPQTGGSAQNTAANGASNTTPQAGGTPQTKPATTTSGPSYNANSLSQQVAGIEKTYGNNSIVTTDTNGNPLITTYTSVGQTFQASRSPANASEAAAAGAANISYLESIGQLGAYNPNTHEYAATK